MLVEDEVVGLEGPEQAATRPAPTGFEAGDTLDDAVRDLITTYHDLNPTTVDTLHEEPSPLEFMRYVARNRPFVIKNGAADWKARKRWNAAYLKEVMAGQTVNVSLTPHGNADSVVDLPCGGSVFVKPYEKDEDFGKVLDAIRAQSQHPPPPPPSSSAGARAKPIRYAQTQNDNLRSEYTSLFADVPASIPFARIALERAPEAVNFWLGSAASVTALHKDNYENMYVQILGRKHFVLLPPVDAPCVAERAVLAGTYALRTTTDDTDTDDADTDDDTPILAINIDDPHTYTPFATWDPDSPLLNTTPYSSLARPMRVTLDPGDMLYLPALWYHKVSQSSDEEGLCCAVNYWYDVEFGGGFWGMAAFVRGVGLVSLGEGGG